MMDLYQQFIHKSRYARWLPEESRREDWDETVKRYLTFLDDMFGVEPTLQAELYKAIYNLDVMPSMRAMMTAGLALERDNVAGYNCAYMPVDSLRSFDECLYILMCGTGVGFSVEKAYTSQLPVISETFDHTDTTIIVKDSKAGWALGLRELLAMLFSGQIPKWDTFLLRAAGAPLKTFGGRSSGPQPLEDLFHFVVEMITKAAGRQLTTLECHDLMCFIASVIVVGGVRRSALISLSDLEDEQMRNCKSGDWSRDHAYRGLANNSAVYTSKPDVSTFLKEWKALYDSKSGERGFFNREAATTQANRNGRRPTNDVKYGTNPCSEIILRPFQFCNLTEVVVRSGDTIDNLKHKARLAAILGTYQSALTDFKYLRRIWQRTTEEERLLGVSLTGIMDCSWPLSSKDLEGLKEVVVETNELYALKLDIPQSAATTCVKPSGTVSQLVNAASGIHPRHSPYYIRTVRSSSSDPIATVMNMAGVPWEWSVTEPEDRRRTMVFSFPIKSPDGSLTRDTMDALTHLDHWLHYAMNWCEHKPSITVSVREDEWIAVADWVYENFDKMSGVSFLPYSDHVYKQAPYQECTKEEYEEAVSKMPKDIDWTKLANLETGDNTTSSQELACTAGVCEVVDLS